MRQAWWGLTLCVGLLTGAGGGAWAGEVPFHHAPVMWGGTVLVAMRDLLATTAPDATLTWDAATQTALIKYGSSSLSLVVGSVTAQRETGPETLAVAPTVRDDTLYAPLRTLAGVLGLEVAYQGGAAPQLTLSRGADTWNFPCPREEEARIGITEMPPSGAGADSHGEIGGWVACGNPTDYRVIVYAGTDHWYIQPMRDDYYTSIRSNGAWHTPTHLGWTYAALLVRKGYQPDTDLGDLPAIGGDIVAIAKATP